LFVAPFHDNRPNRPMWRTTGKRVHLPAQAVLGTVAICDVASQSSRSSTGMGRASR
jgi:hypothetical protein